MDKMPYPPRITVVGSINIDEKITVSKFPDLSETLTAKSHCVGAGGKGANQAVACARAGFRSLSNPRIEVDLIGAVGREDGHFEGIIEPLLRKSGISTEHVIRAANVPTGKSIVTIDDGGENRIIFCPGANFELRAQCRDSLQTSQKPRDTSCSGHARRASCFYHCRFTGGVWFGLKRRRALRGLQPCSNVCIWIIGQGFSQCEYLGRQRERMHRVGKVAVLFVGRAAAAKWRGPWQAIP